MQFRLFTSGLLAVALTAGAQEPVFRSRVDLLRIQVSVADAQGRFVSGLAAEDFSVLVDGKERPAPVAIEVDLGAPLVAPAADDPLAPALDARTLPAAARRHFVLLFDFAFCERRPGLPGPCERRGMREARRSALEFVEREVRPGDLIAVATATRYGLELRVPFTADRAQVLEAVADLRLAAATDAIDIDDDDVQGDYAESIVSGYLETLRDFGEALGAIQGRKHVILLSAGFRDRALVGGSLEERSANTEGRAQLAEPGEYVHPDLETGSTEVRAAIAAAVDAFVGSDTRIHSFDTRGLGPHRQGHVLSYLARETGGEAYFNRNRLTSAFEAVQQSTAQYYLLGFRREPGDADGVEIEVRVRRPGIRVTSAPRRLTPPPAYPDMSPVQRQLQLAEAVAHDGDVVGMRVEGLAVALPPTHTDRSQTLVALEVPRSELVRMARDKQGNPIELELAGFAFDAAGQSLASFQRKLTFAVPSDPSGPPLRWAEILDGPSGSARIRLVVREAQIGDLSAFTRRLPDTNDSSVALAAAAPAMTAALVVAPRSSPVAPEAEPALTVQTMRVAPMAVPTASPGEELLVLVFTADREPEGMRVEGTLVSPGVDGAGQPLTVTGVSSTVSGGRSRLLARLRLPEPVPSGEARLELRLADAAGRIVWHAGSALIVQ